MVCFPNCKINLGLHVLGARADGYHDLETVFYPVFIKDILEIVPALTRQLTFHPTGLAIEGEVFNNLCIKAYNLLQKDFLQLPAVDIYLHKMIPMGAGLGGGSSDGAFCLQLLNKLFQLKLTDIQLIEYALKLGSDCPFFIVNRPVIAIGRGK